MSFSFSDQLLKALTGRLAAEDCDALIAELSAAFHDSSREQATSILSSLATLNVHIEGKGNIVGSNNRLAYVEGAGSAEIADALWQLRQWIAEDEAAESHLRLYDKLIGYVSNLIQDPEFAGWEQRRYFELQLGEEQVARGIRMRFKTVEDTSTQRRDKYTIEESIWEFRRLIIIGEPGSGKTTALRRLAVSFADAFSEALEQGHQSAAAPLPVYVWLPHFNSVVGNTPCDRFDVLIRDAFCRSGIVFEDGEWKTLTDRFQMVLLLDGLDEIGDTNTDLLWDGLNTFTLAHDQHLFVVTSRTYDFRFGKHELPILALLELGYPHDVEEYIRCYLGPIPSRVTQLMSHFEHNLRLRQLAVNPLLLLMIILVFEHEKGGIPNSRGQLFDRIARGLLGEWGLGSQERTDRRYWSEDKHLLLQELGYVMKDEGLELSNHRVVQIFQTVLEKETDWFSPRNVRRPAHCFPLSTQTDYSEVIEELKRDRILLQSRQPGLIRFWHQTLQEYFAASYIWNEIGPLFREKRRLARAFCTTKRDSERKLDSYIADSRWHEIIAIVSGLIFVHTDDGNWLVDDRMVVSFVDKIWRKNRLLAAMCIGNVESFPDLEKLAGYVNHLRKTIFGIGILLPKLFPWLVLAILFAVIWAIPLEEIGTVLNAENITFGIADTTITIIGILLATAIGSGAALLFFRLYAAGNLALETATNTRFIRPSISALRYIRSEAAERLLTEFKARIADDFSIGDTTRVTIETGLVLPVRDERELILMLKQDKTRLQAMERLTELGSQQAIEPLLHLLREARLDRLSYENAIRSLVRIIKLQPSYSMSRLDIESHLRKVLSNRDSTLSQRTSAYKGLQDLGAADITPPQGNVSDAFRAIRAHWQVIVGLSFLLLVALLAYLLFR